MSPPDRLPSCLTNPDASLVAGMLAAEPKGRHMMSFSTWCLSILWVPFCTPSHAGLGHPPGHYIDNCVGHAEPDQVAYRQQHALLRHQAQLAVGRARSQSPLCDATKAKNLAFYEGSTKESSMSARSFWSPNLSQKDCLPGSGAGSGPADVDQHDR